MKRDEQLLYRILDLLEESSAPGLSQSTIKQELSKAGNTPHIDLVLHHLKLLRDRNCVELVSAGTNDLSSWRITDEGHNLAAKNPQRSIDAFAAVGKP